MQRNPSCTRGRATKAAHSTIDPRSMVKRRKGSSLRVSRIIPGPTLSRSRAPERWRRRQTPGPSIGPGDHRPEDQAGRNRERDGGSGGGGAPAAFRGPQLGPSAQHHHRTRFTSYSERDTTPAHRPIVCMLVRDFDYVCIVCMLVSVFDRLYVGACI